MLACNYRSVQEYMHFNGVMIVVEFPQVITTQNFFFSKKRNTIYLFTAITYHGLCCIMLQDDSLKTLELQISAKQAEQESLQERTTNSDAVVRPPSNVSLC